MAADQQTAFDWASEAQEQEEIAAQIVETTPEVAGTAAEPQPEQSKVTLRTTGFDADAYPVGIKAVGLEDELVFDNESATHDVTPQVAEQVRYLSGVEVVS